jgi:hypothetical protein
MHGKNKNQKAAKENPVGAPVIEVGALAVKDVALVAAGCGGDLITTVLLASVSITKISTP